MKKIPRDEAILIIDNLLSSGWTSMLDMCIALNEYALENGYQHAVKREGKTDIEYYVDLMNNGGIYSGDIRSSYFTHMAKIWASVREGKDGAGNKEKRDKYIETVERLNREKIKNYAVSEATLLYVSNAPHVRVISLFSYRDKAYSIKKDLAFYNKNWKRQALNKSLKEELKGVQYDINDALRYSITPEPEIIRRKIKAAENKRRQDALISETTEAIRRRLKDIDERSKTKPAGWMDDVTRLYLYSIYDGIGILDNSVIAPIIEQFYSHLRDHLQRDILPSQNVSIIVNYTEYCNSLAREPKFIQLVSSIADTLSHKDLSFDDTVDILDRCINAWGYFSHMEDDGLIMTKEERALGYAVFDLWVEISYVFNLLKCSVSFAKYRFDTARDLNDIVNSCYGVFAEGADPWDGDLIKECGMAESICLQQCDEFKNAVICNDLTDSFAIGVVDMMRAFISRDITLVPKEIIAHNVIKYGLSQLDDEEKKHFNRMYQTLRFESNWQQFVRLRNKTNSNREKAQRNQRFIILIRHLCESLIDWEIELTDNSPLHQRLISELEDYELRLESESSDAVNKGQRIILKFAIIVLRNKLYPRGLHEGGTVDECVNDLQKGLSDAHKANVSDDELQTLLMMLSMIAIRNTEPPLVFRDDYKDDEPSVISLYSDEMEKDSLRFFSIAEQFVLQMKKGHARRLLEKMIKEQNSYCFILK